MKIKARNTMINSLIADPYDYKPMITRAKSTDPVRIHWTAAEMRTTCLLIINLRTITLKQDMYARYIGKC